MEKQTTIENHESNENSDWILSKVKDFLKSKWEKAKDFADKVTDKLRDKFVKENTDPNTNDVTTNQDENVISSVDEEDEKDGWFSDLDQSLFAVSMYLVNFIWGLRSNAPNLKRDYNEYTENDYFLQSLRHIFLGNIKDPDFPILFGKTKDWNGIYWNIQFKITEDELGNKKFDINIIDPKWNVDPRANYSIDVWKDWTIKTNFVKPYGYDYTPILNQKLERSQIYRVIKSSYWSTDPIYSWSSTAIGLYLNEPIESKDVINTLYNDITKLHQEGSLDMRTILDTQTDFMINQILSGEQYISSDLTNMLYEYDGNTMESRIKTWLSYKFAYAFYLLYPNNYTEDDKNNFNAKIYEAFTEGKSNLKEIYSKMNELDVVMKQNSDYPSQDLKIKEKSLNKDILSSISKLFK